MKTYIKQLIVVFILSTLSMGGYAQTKVVVIPMAGDDIIPEPFAPLPKLSPPIEDYTINDNDTPGSTLDDTVIDNITGLQWQRQDDNTARNWDTAFDYCVSLTLDSKSDWRLPQTHELQSIVAYDVYAPAINESAFLSTDLENFWSASIYASDSSYSWLVDFYYGTVYADDRASTDYYVRCVRSTRPVGPVFQDNGNGTVTDFATGLTWQQSDAHNGSGRNYSDALTYCDGLSLEGGGWRLPAIKELSSIVDLRRKGPSVDLNYLPNTKSSYYWSASSYAYSSISAWYVHFGDGLVYYDGKTSTSYVRCVR